MEMLIAQIDKPYSWLEWDLGLKSLAQEHRPHVTVKYFGSAKINPYALDTLVDDVLEECGLEYCSAFGVTSKSSVTWYPSMFGPNNDIPVLELFNLPEVFSKLNEAFRLIKDDFPKYRPHITVPLEYWTKVKEQNLTPVSEGLLFTGLTLYIGKGS